MDREAQLLEALYWMYIQYCGDSGHAFVSAGEEAAELLEQAGYIEVGEAGDIVKDNYDEMLKNRATPPEI